MPPDAPDRHPAPARPGWATCSAPGARAYEVTFSRLLGRTYRALARDLCAHVDPTRAAHIVDVGAGPGVLATELAQAFPGSRITALDLDVEMAALARARMARANLTGRVRVMVGDVGHLPLADGSVDLVTSSFSVHHWPEAPAGFAEVRRVLRPGGRAVVYDLPDWWGRLETRAPGLAASARAGGFGEVTPGRLAWPWRIGVVQRIVAIG